MIRQFKQGNYAEVRGAIVRKGDLIVISGVVGILHTDYDPDYMELETEGGPLHTHFGYAEVVKLRRIEHTNGIRGLNLKKARTWRELKMK